MMALRGLCVLALITLPSGGSPPPEDDWCSNPSALPPGSIDLQGDVGQFDVFQCFDGTWEQTAILAVNKIATGEALEWWAYKIADSGGTNGDCFVHPGVPDRSIIADLRFDYESEPPESLGDFHTAAVSAFGSNYEVFECYSFKLKDVTGPALPVSAPADPEYCVKNSPDWGVGRFEVFQCFGGEWTHTASVNLQERVPGKSYVLWWALRIDTGTPPLAFVRPSQNDPESTLRLRKADPPEETLSGFESTLPWKARIFEETMIRHPSSP